ncbi:ParA family protein [Veillonella criceti]|uniref:Sporulation initiation inhibitor protein Soj n=1 Tax=Veillonella criceti TaxID=103891 RepID=A0A380NNN1_9FIRM|nr:AAA family ATPase [Veillonella criceti]SUP43958.1 Sporulation initiation inhibitor protein soj [Veillonella criceti]
MGKIIAITNQKGGVGKTTTSVNLSACIAKLGKKVLLIDMDPQGNASSGLGIDKDNLDSCIYDVLINDMAVEDVIVPTAIKKLKIAPASIDLAGASVELVGLSKREYILKKALKSIKDEFDYIFIDCPPSLDLLTLNALVAANGVLIPIQSEFYALEGVSQLMNTINLVKKSLNEKLDVEGVLLTMFDGRTNLSIQVADEVKKYFTTKVYKTIIPRNVRLSEAPSYGEPIIIYDPKSKGAEVYMKLAKEVLKNA